MRRGGLIVLLLGLALPAPALAADLDIDVHAVSPRSIKVTTIWEQRGHHGRVSVVGCRHHDFALDCGMDTKTARANIARRRTSTTELRARYSQYGSINLDGAALRPSPEYAVVFFPVHYVHVTLTWTVGTESRSRTLEVPIYDSLE